MIETSEKGLDVAAIKVADEKFYAAHPEFAGRVIDPYNPEHKKYKDEWWRYYRSVKSSSPTQPENIEKKAEEEKKLAENNQNSFFLFTDYTAGSSTQTCPYGPQESSSTAPDYTQPPAEESCQTGITACKITVTIGCEHGRDRLGNAKILEVVPSNTGGDNIILDASLASGTGCGTPVTWEVTGGTSKTLEGNSTSLKVTPPAFRHMSISPLGRWAMKAVPTVYRISPSIPCGTVSGSYTVKVYPSEQFSIKITPTSWGFYKKLEECLNEFCDMVFGENRLNFIAPQGSISMNAQWKEHTDNTAFYAYEIVVGFDPLFGVTSRIPLLDALRSLSIPPKAIDWVRRYIGDLLYLAIEGKLGVSAHLQRVAPEIYANWAATAKGELIIKLGLEVGKSKKVLSFNASGETGITLQFGVSGHKKDPSDKIFEADMLFNGLKTKMSIEVAGGWLSFEEEYQVIEPKPLLSNHALTVFD